MPENTKSLTPKRAAQVLAYEWITMGGTSPWYMDAEEMTYKLEQYNYRVTEIRREHIIKQLDNIIEPLRAKLANRIQDFTNI